MNGKSVEFAEWMRGNVVAKLFHIKHPLGKQSKDHFLVGNINIIDTTT